MKPIQTFIVTNEIPSELSNLKELAYNFWWCWNSEARELFIRIDRDLWEECSHNPILLLNKVSKDVLHELAQKPDFIRFLNYNYERFQNYMKSQTWYNEMRPDNQKEVIAYFSTEYGINESFPNYSGGLGVLSGDHLKSASDIGLPLVGVGLLYQQGYFRQNINQNGWQTELYPYNDFFSMPIVQIKDENIEWIFSDKIGEEKEFDRIISKFLKKNRSTAIVCCNFMILKHIQNRTKNTTKLACFDYSGDTWKEENILCSISPSYEIGMKIGKNIIMMLEDTNYKIHDYSYIFNPTIYYP